MSRFAGGAPQLHQICIVDGFDLPPSMPEILCENIDSFRAAHPGCAHTLWSGNALRDFLAKSYEPAVLAAFDLLRPYSYKSDLGRLCVLHHFGGIYADLAMRFLTALQPPATIGFAAFRSLNFLTDNWTTMSNGIVWAHAGRRECRIAIGAIVRNCRTRFYGSTCLSPTGPVLLGQAAAAAMVERGFEQPPDQWIGQIVPSASARGVLQGVSPDRQVVALNEAGQKPGRPRPRRHERLFRRLEQPRRLRGHVRGVTLERNVTRLDPCAAAAPL